MKAMEHGKETIIFGAGTDAFYRSFGFAALKGHKPMLFHDE
jgi:hypothetical protein